MKCVRLVGEGMPVRITDEEAHRTVTAHNGDYCSKKFFRDWWAIVPDSNSVKQHVMDAWAKARASVATFTSPKRRRQ